MYNLSVTPAAIALTYSPWLLLVCLVLAFLGTTVLYYKNARWQEVSKTAWWSMAALRFSALLLLSFLLLRPLFKSRETIFEKPVLAVLIDNSSSVAATTDPEIVSEKVKGWLDVLQSAVGNRYDLVPMVFGSALRTATPDFKDQQTDFGQAFRAFHEQFRGANVGAMLMLTDGIPTIGVHPLNQPEATRYRFFGLGLGDTTIRKDARISEVLANKVAFSGNQFQVEIFAQFDGFQEAAGEIRILRDNQEVDRATYQVNGPNTVVNKRFVLEAGAPGLAAYQVRMTTYDGEENTRNNQSSFYVEIKERRKKVAFITDSPHPDIAAMRRSLESFDEFEVSVFYMKDLPASLRDYHLLIAHQLPGKRAGAGVPNVVASFPNAVLYVLGRDMDLPRFPRFQQRIAYEGGINMETLFPKWHPGFTLFGQSPEAANFFNNLPPLEGLMTPLRFSGNGENLLNYRIGKVATERPLIFLGMDEQQRKYGLINGTGIWRWRMEAFRTRQDFRLFDDWFVAMVQYLTTDEVKERLEIRHPSRVAQFAPLRFEGLLLNPAFEPVNAPELSMTITESQGTSRNYAFSRTTDRYALSINDLPPGSYSYKATTTLGKERFEKNGGFVVEQADAEFMVLQAQHDWMRQLAIQTGGGFSTPDQMEALINQLKAEDIAPIRIKSSLKSQPFLNNLYWLLVVALLLGLEWFIRKRSGAY
jgi:hypothetical protein